MWTEVAAHWEDQVLHDRFVQRCFVADRLAAAGARYAAHLEAHPADEIARRMRDRVVFLSMQALASSARRPVPWRFVHSPRFLLMLLVGVALGAVLGIIYGAHP